MVHVDAEQTPLDVTQLVGSIGRHPLGGVTEFYMCGPIRLMDAVRREWEAATLPAVNLRFETFGSSGWFQPEEFAVSVAERQMETTVGTDETVLEALIRAGVDLMYDCRKGECGRSLSTCVSRVAAPQGSSTRPRVSLRLP